MMFKRKFRTCVIIILIFGILSVGFSFYYQYIKQEKISLKKHFDYYNNIMQSEKVWLASLQLSNGALPFRGKDDGDAYIVPYFSDITAIALIKRSPEYKTIVANYFDWHFRHLNTKETDKNGIAGTIYNYNAEVVNGIVQSETTERKYDSIDSYAAFFLIALWEYYEQTEDKEYLYIHYSDILSVVNALEATIDETDGLSYVKPEYQVKYLMDNAEVYKGISCSLKLFKQVFLPHYAENTREKNEVKQIIKRLSDLIERQNDSIEEKLWNMGEYRYEIGLNNVGECLDFTGWEKFYPDAVAQLFPIVFGIIQPDTERAQSLYTTFNEYYDWEYLQHHENGDAKFYWGILSYSGALMHDEKRVNAYLDYYEANLMPNHEYPIYNADVAWVVLACSEMAHYYEDQMGKIDPLGLVNLG